MKFQGDSKVYLTTVPERGVTRALARDAIIQKLAKIFI